MLTDGHGLEAIVVMLNCVSCGFYVFLISNLASMIQMDKIIEMPLRCTIFNITRKVSKVTVKLNQHVSEAVDRKQCHGSN